MDDSQDLRTNFPAFKDALIYNQVLMQIVGFEMSRCVATLTPDDVTMHLNIPHFSNRTGVSL